ncbi:hypothetical protein MKW92_051559 [Papaver armeniacum]|nr:hypothetical protein MKW92_051559 [Papaver armeniacum]
METKKIIAPYGTWISPITADAISRAQKRLHGIAVDGHGHLLWVESRPRKFGRGVLVMKRDKHGDEPIDITPDGFAVRTLVHEYGGRGFAVYGIPLFSQIIRIKDSTSEIIESVMRDGVFDSGSKSYVTVMEDHRESSLNPSQQLYPVDLGGETNQANGPQGERLAWIEWGHPNMQWDKAELWVGYISKEGSRIAGGDPTLVESPSSPSGHRNNGFGTFINGNEVVPIYTTDAEFTRPFWVFVLIQLSMMICRQSGKSYLGILDDVQNSLTVVDVPFTDIGNIVSGSDCIYVEGATGVLPLSIAKVTLDQSKVEGVDFSTMWSSSPDSRKYGSNFSIPEPIEFPTEVTGQKAYAYFYPPSNPRYLASDEEKPPLLLTVHGGPTAETRGILDLNVQYWTSRGWAVVDVNYGGSTGYGREYRQRLLGNWGVVDVNDCCSCAKFLISDLNSLNEEMPPKFELHYTSNLGGSDKDMFERSPINFVDKFSCPVILFQGLDDKIVTPVQARKIYKALKQKGSTDDVFARLIGHFKVADEITPINIDNLD